MASLLPEPGAVAAVGVGFGGRPRPRARCGASTITWIGSVRDAPDGRQLLSGARHPSSPCAPPRCPTPSADAPSDRRMSSIWFPRLGDVPGIDYSPPMPVERARIPGHDVRPEVRSYTTDDGEVHWYVRWGWRNSDWAPVRQHTERIFREEKPSTKRLPQEDHSGRRLNCLGSQWTVTSTLRPMCWSNCGCAG